MMNNIRNQPLPPRFSLPSTRPQDFESLSYRFIEPDEYQSLGINSDDVPMGTFAAMDHPPFLPSRVGGNAYGFGFIEKSYLNEEDIKFLESIQEDDPRVLSKHARRINEIYKKLGLLIRVSYKGFRFYLIPINLITHSLQDVKCKADEIERIIIKHVFKKNKERLDIGILTYENDLIVHELVGRMPTMKFTTFDNLKKLGKYPGSFDLIILPKSMYEFLFNIIPEITPENIEKKDQLFRYACYLSGKIYDMLEPGGEFFTTANCLWPRDDQTVEVKFTNELELKNFLIFTHLFETKSKPLLKGGSIELRLRDLYWYLNGAYVYDETLQELIGDRSVLSLSLEEIENLPYLNIKINETILSQSEELWDEIILPFFTPLNRKQVLPEYLKEYLEKNLLSDIELPGTIFLFLGEKKKPFVSLPSLRKEVDSSGLAGCKLELVAHYRNTFEYLLNVLNRVDDILSGTFDKISEVQSYRLRSLFESRRTSKRFRAIEKLLKRREDLKLLAYQFNPERIEARDTPLLENIEKMSLVGFEHEELQEILLIVLGHTTLGRITLGKLPERSLSQVTSKAGEWGLIETISVFRLSLLMSVAEIAASLGNTLTKAQIKELFSLYEDILEKINEKGIDWDRYEEEVYKSANATFKRGIREILKLFNLFEYLDNWDEIIKKGPFEREVLTDFDLQKKQQIKRLITLVKATEKLESKYNLLLKDESGGFLRKIIQTEFHGTGHLFPNLEPKSGLTLLWLSVNAAKGKIVNFNPLIKYTSSQNYQDVINNYHRILRSIRIDELDDDFFSDIHEKLSGEPGFVFVLGTGFQLKFNKKTGALDISHVDIHNNLAELKQIVEKYQEYRVSSIPLDQLKKLEDLFTAIHEYYIYAKERDLSTQQDVSATAEFFLSRESEITVVLDQLTQMFRAQLLVPEEIYDNFTLLTEHCPGMTRYLVPELTGLAYTDNHPSGSSSGNHFVLWCFRKLQALVREDKELFQDQKVFYQIAQQEFGPFTAENVAANQFQIDNLTNIVSGLKKEPYTLETLALSFLLTGKRVEHLGQHLRKFNIPEEKNQILNILLQHSGLLEKIIYGEESLEELHSITKHKSSSLLKAFFIHEIIRIASQKEGKLTEDLLDLCFSYYTLAKRVLSDAYTWEQIEERLNENKIRPQLVTKDIPDGKQVETNIHSESVNSQVTEKNQVAAFERLLRLAGLIWIDYLDILMAESGVPVTFIYRKKALRSLGIKTFKRELQRGQKIIGLLEREGEHIKNFILTSLYRSKNKLHFHRFKDLAGYLSLDNWIKLLLLVIRVSEEYFSKTGETLCKNITFQRLYRNLDLRYEILNESLNGLSPLWIVNKCNIEAITENGINGITFHQNRLTGFLEVDFKDPINIGNILSEMSSIEDVENLNSYYKQKLNYLKNLQFFTRDYQEQLEQHFHKKLHLLNDKLIKSRLQAMLSSSDFHILYGEFEELNRLGTELGFTKEQYSKITYIFNKRQNELRDITLNYYRKEVRAVSEASHLKELWEKVKFFLVENSAYYSRDFQLEIAKIFDDRLKSIRKSQK